MKRGNDGKQQGRYYIACSDLEFGWTKDEIKVVRNAWDAGFGTATISKALNRDPDEVLLLLVDLRRKGAVKRRGGRLEDYI